MLSFILPKCSLRSDVLTFYDAFKKKNPLFIHGSYAEAFGSHLMVEENQ